MANRTTLRATVTSLALAAALLTGVGCSESPAPNVILISIDTLRQDRLGCYGYERDSSPSIDRLARGGTMFLNAFSPAAWTLPAHASMLTGLTPRRHGAVHAQTTVREDARLLAELLREQGYSTAAVVNAPFMQAKFGFDRGFDTFDYVPKLEVARHQDAVLETLRVEREQPFFYFFHYMSVHDPYAPDDEFNRFTGSYEQPIGVDGQKLLKLWRAMDRGERSLNDDEVRYLDDLYTGGVLSVDARIGQLLERLEALGLNDDTIVVLCSDHGEEFMEHGSIVHTKTLYDELLAVPLIFRGPGVPAGVRVRSMAALIDIVPTLLALSGVGAPPGIDGVDLAEYWRDDSVPHRLLEIETSWVDGTRASRGIRTPTHKLIVDLETGSREFYDLARDPGETENLYPHPDAEDLSRALKALPDRAVGGEVELSPEDVEQLRSLGYVD